MDELPDALVSEVAQIYLVANTPAYLYRHLVGCNLYDKLRDWPVVDLVNLYHEAQGTQPRTAETAGVAYCALIALICGLETDRTLELQAEGLRWVRDVIEIVERRRESETAIEIEAAGSSQRQWLPGRAESTDVHDVNVERRGPEIIVEA